MLWTVCRGIRRVDCIWGAQRGTEAATRWLAICTDAEQHSVSSHLLQRNITVNCLKTKLLSLCLKIFKVSMIINLFIYELHNTQLFLSRNSAITRRVAACYIRHFKKRILAKQKLLIWSCKLWFIIVVDPMHWYCQQRLLFANMFQQSFRIITSQVSMQQLAHGTCQASSSLHAASLVKQGVKTVVQSSQPRHIDRS
jgi:hypothetical protein